MCELDRVGGGTASRDRALLDRVAPTRPRRRRGSSERYGAGRRGSARRPRSGADRYGRLTRLACGSNSRGARSTGHYRCLRRRGYRGVAGRIWLSRSYVLCRRLVRALRPVAHCRRALTCCGRRFSGSDLIAGGRLLYTHGQQRERIDIAIRVGGDPDPEVDVRGSAVVRRGRDRADRLSFAHDSVLGY